MSFTDSSCKARSRRQCCDPLRGCPGQTVAPATVRQAAPDVRAEIHLAKRNIHVILQQAHQLNVVPLNSLRSSRCCKSEEFCNRKSTFTGAAKLPTRSTLRAQSNLPGSESPSSLSSAPRTNASLPPADHQKSARASPIRPPVRHASRAPYGPHCERTPSRASPRSSSGPIARGP
jgi:hypothetical protein